MKTSSAIRLIAQQIYDAYQTGRVAYGDAPAKTIIARLHGLKYKEVNDCIKYIEKKGKIKLNKSAKEFTGKVTRADCDLLWAKAVKASAGHKCEKENCHNKDLQAHHIISRTNYALRFDIENGVCLCTYHHLFWAHKDALSFSEWVKTKRNIPALELKRGNRTRQDYAAIALYLTERIKQLTQKKAA